MFILKTFMFQFLCITTLQMEETHTNRLSELKHVVRSSGIKSVWLSTNISKVIIKDIQYDVYIYDPNFEFLPGYYDNTLYKLYICINCEFAKWVRIHLYKLIEDSPQLYTKTLPEHLKYPNYHLLKNFKKSETIVNTILYFIQRFINILLNFTNIYEHDLSVDTDVLRALLLLSFKINSIKSLNSDKSDNNIIRLILGSLNSFENFILINCKLTVFYSGSKQLFGYPIYTGSEKNDMNDFLNDINPLQLEFYKLCTTKQLLLFDEIPSSFMDIKWRTRYGTIKVEQVMKKLNDGWYNLDIMFWYQTYMFNTIMKIFLTEVQNYFKKHSTVSKKIENDFNHIYFELFFGVTNIPPYIIECVSLIIPKRNQSYTEKVITFILPNELYNPNMFKKIKTCLNLFQDIGLETHYNSIQVASQNVDEDSTNDNLIFSLEGFIQYVHKNIDAFKCFIRLFDFLHSENNKMYNTPVISKSENIKSFVRDLLMSSDTINENTISELDLKSNMLEEEKLINNDILKQEGCIFFSGLYHYCVDTVIHLNMANAEQENKNDMDDYYSQAQLNLAKIKSYLIELVNGYWSFDGFKIIYNVVPFIELLEKYNFPQDYEDMHRIVLVIMTEFNGYNIEFCNPPEFKFLLLDTMNFDMMGLLTTSVNDGIEVFLNKIKIDFEYIYYNYLEIRSLFQNFNDISNIFERYKNVIKFNWKGEKLNIGEISEILKFSIISPPNLYALYDVYLKVPFAMLYYEIYKVYKAVEDPKINGQNDFVVFRLISEFFPKFFEDLIININEFTNYYTSINNTHIKINSVENRIMNLFKQLGIFINLSHSIQRNVITLKLNDIFKDAQHNTDIILQFLTIVLDNYFHNKIYGSLF